MKVGDLMSRNVRSCGRSASLNEVARMMWESDCGCVPVVEDNGAVVGMITDRDVCMAAYTQGRRLMFMDAASACSKSIVTIGENESLERAEELMRTAQVRRLPVVDPAGHLVGLLSVSDFARYVSDLGDRVGKPLVGAMAGICQPRHASSPQDEAGSDLKNELRRGIARLQTLRDEVRVRLHLGSLELKDQWRKLEPHLGEVEKRAEELTDASRSAIQDAVKRLETLRASLSTHN